MDDDYSVPEDKAYMTEDGLFLVIQASPGSRPYNLLINDCGWRFITEVSSLRCARVWIKNFYRTMTIVQDDAISDFARKLQYRTMYEGICIAMCELFQEKPKLSTCEAVKIIQKENMKYALEMELELEDAEIRYQGCIELSHVPINLINQLAR
jgi:hypothetical protein